MHPLVKDLLAGNQRAAARLITLLENNSAVRGELLKELDPLTGGAHIIGVTGPPGSGKSSLVAKLVKFLRKANLTVGIIAVDPSSPFSGGALLGDRVRMQDWGLDPGVYIRSMGTRGQLGGLARATTDCIKVLDAGGKDFIIIETAGVGQSEVDIMEVADSVLVVLTPGAGDGIQAQKAGLMEIAHIFVLNKADLAGADKAVRELKEARDMAEYSDEWCPPVVKSSAATGEGLEELMGKIREHQSFLESSGHGALRRQERREAEVWSTLQEELLAYLQLRSQEDKRIAQTLEKVQVGQLSPYEGAQLILATVAIIAN